MSLIRTNHLTRHLRRLAERVSRRVVLKRHLPERFGRLPLLVTPGSALRYWYRDLQRVDGALLELAEEFVRRGSVVWDIGANVGLFTFAAAAMAGPEGAVLAVEADVHSAALLHRSRLLGHDGRRAPIAVLAAAVADRVGVAGFNYAARGGLQISLQRVRADQAQAG